MKYKQSVFEGVPKKQLNKSRFDLSHQWKGEFNPGELIPCLVEEMMPGDEPELSSEYMFRFDSLYFPIMVLMTMRADTYWCPNRILWPEGTDTNVGWKRWIAEQEEIIPPYMNANMTFDVAAYNNSILAHMGLPYLLPGATKTTVIPNLSAFALSAFLAIWDEYERNPLLEDERWFPLVAGNNTTSFDTAFNVQVPGDPWIVFQTKWMKDYFTSAIPTPQLGDAIQIPMVANDETGFPTGWINLGTGAQAGAGSLSVGADGNTDTNIPQDVGLNIQETAATIKQLRLAEVLQSFYERIAKVGTRYRDWIKAFFRDDPEPGVVDVPVLIRSTFGRVQIADVMTTADTGSTEGADITAFNTGNYRGQANLYEAGNQLIKYHCKEHGFLIQIVQVNPDTSYGQGIARFWRRSVQTDYPMDIFSGIGDQEILKEELFYNSITTQLSKNQDTFGYIPRFSEMRYRNNIHTGYLNFEPGLSMHLGRWWDIDNIGNYDDLEIDADFVNAGVNSTTVGNGGQRHSQVYKVLPVYPPIVSTPIFPIIKAHIFHSLKVNRALPVFSTPGKGI